MRVAVGAVDDRLELRCQLHRLTGEIDGEVGRFGLSIDFDALEHPSVGTDRGQDAADAFDHVQVGILEHVLALHRCQAGFVRVPGPEYTARLHTATRHRIGQARLEARTLGGAEVAQHQIMNLENTWQPAWAPRCDLQCRRP
jgi:hypothetical protein